MVASLISTVIGKTGFKVEEFESSVFGLMQRPDLLKLTEVSYTSELQIFFSLIVFHFFKNL